MAGDVIRDENIDETRSGLGLWHDYALGDSRVLELRLGSLTLAVQHLTEEWRAGYRRSATEATGEVHFRQSVNWDECDETQRLVLHDQSDRLRLYPALADRPVIIRSASPLLLPAGEQVTLYVSSPIWVRLEVGESSRLLLDIPAMRPSDTWFGPSTREGELCYAARTLGRLRLTDLPRRAHRAITPLVIRNQSDSDLAFEKVSLPAPHLSLFTTAEGFLWTQQVTMERIDADEPETLRIGDGAASEAKGGTLLTRAREEPDERILKKAWSTLFG